MAPSQRSSSFHPFGNPFAARSDPSPRRLRRGPRRLRPNPARQRREEGGQGKRASAFQAHIAHQLLVPSLPNPVSLFVLCQQKAILVLSDPRHPLQNGETPLHSACLSGHTECLRVLLERGADKDMRDKVRAQTFRCQGSSATHAGERRHALRGRRHMPLCWCGLQKINEAPPSHVLPAAEWRHGRACRG